MIKRESKFYATGFDGSNSKQAPFYKRALVFDSEVGNLNNLLVKEFNLFLSKKINMQRYFLPNYDIVNFPEKVVIINASSDDLPTSYETARIFTDCVKEKSWPIKKIHVVNTRQELINAIYKKKKPDKVLVISQCVDKKVYDKDLACKFKKDNITVIPGELTAPGSIFSDKDLTYSLLSKKSTNWTSVAKYRKIDFNDKDSKYVAKDILKACDELSREIKKNNFFVKPNEGGGGLGGFRIIKHKDNYIIPDLSKVTGESHDIKPTFLDINLNDKNRVKELFWIYRLFKSDSQLCSNYLKIDTSYNLKDFEKYLKDSLKKQNQKLAGMSCNREKAIRLISRAIDKFEEKFNKRYIPLVNEHIDFGCWGLRAHYRLSNKGIILETIYARIFQIAFTPEGVGYVGSDNISNKQTGELEISRLGPINNIMLDAIGGKNKLFKVLLKGIEPFSVLLNLSKDKIPFRLQIDLAAISGLIGEVNSDSARGLCLASNWKNFVENTKEWFLDSLGYYSNKFS